MFSTPENTCIGHDPLFIGEESCLTANYTDDSLSPRVGEFDHGIETPDDGLCGRTAECVSLERKVTPRGKIYSHSLFCDKVSSGEFDGEFETMVKNFDQNERQNLLEMTNCIGQTVFHETIMSAKDKAAISLLFKMMEDFDADQKVKVLGARDNQQRTLFHCAITSCPDESVAVQMIETLVQEVEKFEEDEKYAILGTCGNKPPVLVDAIVAKEATLGPVAVTKLVEMIQGLTVTHRSIIVQNVLTELAKRGEEIRLLNFTSIRTIQQMLSLSNVNGDTLFDLLLNKCSEEQRLEMLKNTVKSGEKQTMFHTAVDANESSVVLRLLEIIEGTKDGLDANQAIARILFSEEKRISLFHFKIAFLLLRNTKFSLLARLFKIWWQGPSTVPDSFSQESEHQAELSRGND